ncbi:TPA: hypothetical protein SL239_005807 [Pseudomonas aeruginosa]|nr:MULTISPECIES: hypothetical protein [Pseudomonas]EKX2112672.1 hypothetical protein [Pseudomonas aeruginosa]MBG4356559.1 hypothetical protein [Pseudomonas aeruginosa]MBH4315441.1 hypothetical protein [Pseudomonas aeruginosa]MBH8703494.1 hypothetical protein [Pseudomonas aeruginosa]MCU9019873.1 hypothetical protein [Pseudomonas aeruginosa]
MSVSIEVFLLFLDGFYRQGPGDLLMPGKPHETSFPEQTFTVKDGLGLDSERDGLNPAFSSYRQFHRQPVLLACDSHR